MATPKMNSEQLRWQAESDADIMARYEEIMSSSSRRNAAIKVAREQAANLNKRASVMSRIASSKPSTKKK